MLEFRRAHCFLELGGHKQPLKEECQHSHTDENQTAMDQGAPWGQANLKFMIGESKFVSTQYALWVDVRMNCVHAKEILSTQ